MLLKSFVEEKKNTFFFLWKKNKTCIFSFYKEKIVNDKDL